MPTKPLGLVVLLSLTVLGSYSVAPAQEEQVEPASATEASDTANRVSPRIIPKTQQTPTYPPAAKAARYTGSVMLETVVQPDGRVGDVKVLECTRPKVGFEQSAIDAVKNWRFEPGTVDGKPAEVTLRFRLNFAPGGVSMKSEHIPSGASQSSSSGDTGTTGYK